MSPLADIIHELAPIDRTMAAFERGGPRCAKAIGRLWERLRELEDKSNRIDRVGGRVGRCETALMA